jgi:hypothetical protein
MATQTQPQPAAQVSGKLSDQNLLIRRDVYEALPAFYRCFVDVMVSRKEWHIIEPGAV